MLLERITMDNSEITLDTYPEIIGFYQKHNFVVVDQKENRIKMKVKQINN